MHALQVARLAVDAVRAANATLVDVDDPSRVRCVSTLVRSFISLANTTGLTTAPLLPQQEPGGRGWTAVGCGDSARRGTPNPAAQLHSVVIVAPETLIKSHRSSLQRGAYHSCTAAPFSTAENMYISVRSFVECRLHHHCPRPTLIRRPRRPRCEQRIGHGMSRRSQTANQMLL